MLAEGAQDANLNLACVAVLFDGADDLDGDLAALELVVALDDLAKSALSELLEDLIPAVSVRTRVADVLALADNVVAVLVVDGLRGLPCGGRRRCVLEVGVGTLLLLLLLVCVCLLLYVCGVDACLCGCIGIGDVLLVSLGISTR